MIIWDVRRPEMRKTLASRVRQRGGSPPAVRRGRGGVKKDEIGFQFMSILMRNNVIIEHVRIPVIIIVRLIEANAIDIRLEARGFRRNEVDTDFGWVRLKRDQINPLFITRKNTVNGEESTAFQF